MRSSEVTIIPTGSANIASIVSSLRRVGAFPQLARNSQDILQAERIILPGVGSFGSAMGQLRQHGIVDVLVKKVTDGTPMLAICLGMQLLFDSSEESPGIAGLSILHGNIASFPVGRLRTHVGWNTIESDKQAILIREGDAYFTHSYRLVEPPENAVCAVTCYGETFVSAFEIGNILACQFHPELSGAWGLDLLRRWVNSMEGPC